MYLPFSSSVLLFSFHIFNQTVQRKATILRYRIHAGTLNSLKLNPSQNLYLHIKIFTFCTEL